MNSTVELLNSIRTRDKLTINSSESLQLNISLYIYIELNYQHILI